MRGWTLTLWRPIRIVPHINLARHFRRKFMGILGNYSPFLRVLVNDGIQFMQLLFSVVIH